MNRGIDEQEQKGGDGSEQRGEEILQSIEFMGGEIGAQPVDREIGIDDAHDGADDEQKDEYLRGVVEEEVDSRTDTRLRIKS